MDMRCLVVDDDTGFRTALCHMLERGGAVVAATASNGAEAVERATDTHPDIVLVDVRLGSESGFDVACRIDESAAGTGWSPVVILVSTQTEDELTALVAAHPAFGFLDKTTVSPARIRELLSASSGSSRR
ncbi:response regulator [Actinoallomurus sp. CA-142502]|uniref:response regulator n=1 Tax=Actinoallomurus sp. CA-142502 TaxID=3239885 RepID=UPI003D8F8587